MDVCVKSSSHLYVNTNSHARKISIYILIYHICGDFSGLCQRKVAKTIANLSVNIFFYFIFLYMNLLAFVWFVVFHRMIQNSSLKIAHAHDVPNLCD